MFYKSFFRKSMYLILSFVMIVAQFSIFAFTPAKANDIETRAIPNTPGNLLSVGYTNAIQTITYSVTNVTYYQVWRSQVSASSGYQHIADTDRFEYSLGYEYGTYYDYDVVNQTTYYYKWKACNASGCSDFSPVTSRKLGMLDPPTNIQASQNTYADKVRITWDLDSSNVDIHHYKVYRASSSTGSYLSIGDTYGTGSGSFDDYDAPAGQKRYYKVSACTDNDNCSEPSSEIAEGWPRLPAPNLSTTQGTRNGYVSISWGKHEQATYFELLRGNNSQSFNTTWTLQKSPEPYQDYSVSGTNHYWYTVRACSTLGCSSYRSPVEGWAGAPPPPPTNINASDGLENNIYVSWNASNGANYYEVYRAPTASGAYEKQSERVVDLFWRDIYTEPGVTYWYKVKACNWNEGGTCSELSTSHNDGLRTGPPMPPTNLQASDGAFSDKIRISWNAVPGADFYLVKSNTVKDLETATPTCAVTQTSCDHESITPGTLYYYWICTYSGKYGEFSNPETGYAQGPPTAPNNVQASDGEFVEKVRLTWEESPSAEAYRVYRHTENNPNAATSIGTSNNTFFDDTTAVQGQIYWYWVKSLRHSYPESGFSIPADTGYRKGLPAPTNLGVSKGNYIAKVRLLWNTVANAQYYGIYRNTVFNFETSQFLSTISNNYYDDLNTEEGTLYYYWVTAGNDAFGEGGKSVPDKGYWKGLSAPTQLQASDGTYTDKIHLTWVAADHAQSYKVYRSTINIPESATLIGETSNTFFDDTNVDQDWVYTYWITSVHDLLIVEDSRFSAPDIGYASDEFLFRFDDVPDGYWAEDYIYRLHASGITIGCSQVPPLYCPEQNVTRAEMAVFLERGLNDPGYLPPPGNGALFADVPITYWAVNWIEQLYTDGITVGCDTSPLRYCPDQSVTRAEMSAFLLRAKYGAGFSPPIVTESQFADVPLTHWAVNWVARLAADGITTGVTPTQFNPEGFVTRAQMAAFLVRTFELP